MTARSLSGPSLKGVPRPALLLGVAGLIPFAAGALAVTLLPDHRELAARLLLAYGATILAFLGGVHWGLAMAAGGRDRTADPPAAGRLALSVLPQLIAWSAFFWPNPATGMFILVIGIAATLLAEQRGARARLIPEWYLRLRSFLSYGALACLIAAGYAL